MSGQTFAAADRRALRAVATQFFCNGVVFASFVPRLPEIRDQIGGGVDTVGFVLSASAVIGVLGSVVVSPLIERAGTRRVLLVGGIGLTVSLVGVGQTRSAVALLVALACLQISDIFVDVAMNMQGSWLSARRHAPVMNRLHGMWSLGTVFGGLVSAAVAGRVPLPTHLAVAGAVMLLVVVGVTQGLLREDEESSFAPVADPGGSSPRRRTISAGLPLIFTLGVVALVMEATSYDWAAFRLTDDLGAPAGVASLGFVAVTTGMMVGRFSGDHLQARLNDRGLRRGAVALVGVGLLIGTLTPSCWIVIVGFALVGLGNATLLPGLYDRAAQWPGRRGAGMGALTGGLRVAGLLAPVAVGALADTSLGVGLAMLLVTGPCVVAFAVLEPRVLSYESRR